MKWLKVGAVICVAVVLTALGIDAADTLTGKGGTMLGQLVSTESGVCPVGMVEVPSALSFTCVDQYEAAAGASCPNKTANGSEVTQQNLNEFTCQAVSESKRSPWTYVTREQAQTLCARAGKRLPTSEEWYQAALGVVDSATACNVDRRAPNETGDNTQCVSAAGAEDMIGNVWEWVKDDVIDGTLAGRTLPEEGFVTQVDSAGIATITGANGEDLFARDYFWVNTAGAYGILRGGFYSSESDAGLYAVQAKTVPTSATVAIGFRCVK